ncbi:MAG: energy transducer TonB, partial [bacterium]
KERRPRGADRIFAFDPNLFASKQKPRPEKETSPGNGGSLDDFYPDFRRGARTYLNVLRYPEVEYFVRLKRAFKMTFNPEPSLREHFSQNLITRGSIDVVLGVSVDKMGNLTELFVFRGSGVPTYDKEALRTVRASSPFAQPPSKFTDDDGMLRMSWTFSVYL